MVVVMAVMVVREGEMEAHTHTHKHAHTRGVARELSRLQKKERGVTVTCLYDEGNFKEEEKKLTIFTRPFTH